jgi:hypothetical protein
MLMKLLNHWLFFFYFRQRDISYKTLCLLNLIPIVRNSVSRIAENPVILEINFKKCSFILQYTLKLQE